MLQAQTLLDSRPYYSLPLTTSSVLLPVAVLNSSASNQDHPGATLVFRQARSDALLGFRTFPTFWSFKRFAITLFSS